MKEMLISVIIPVFNGQNFIDKCVKSILNQTYKNIEIILFDDASKDNSRKKLKELSDKHDKISYYYTNTNFGPGGAKNEGLKRAKGEYVLFVDCDDYIGPAFINDLVRVALENSKPDIILCGYTKVDENGKIIFIRKYKNQYDALFQRIFSTGKLMKRVFITKNNLTLPYGKVMEDLLFHPSIMLNNPTCALSDSADYFYVYNNQSISQTTMKKVSEGSLKIALDFLKEMKYGEKKELLDYFAYKYVCWYLLKSCNNVGKSIMMKEYNYAFLTLDKYFDSYKKSKMITFLNPKHEKVLIRFVIYIILILRKINLDKLFFNLYSRINLSRFWPNL